MSLAQVFRNRYPNTDLPRRRAGCLTRERYSKAFPGRHLTARGGESLRRALPPRVRRRGLAAAGVAPPQKSVQRIGNVGKRKEKKTKRSRKMGRTGERQGGKSRRANGVSPGIPRALLRTPLTVSLALVEMLCRN